MERKSPEQANDLLRELWNRAKESVIKLALLQDGERLLEPKMMEAWQRGDFETALTHLYASQGMRDFSQMTHDKIEQDKIKVIRIHIIDDALPSVDPSYLDLLVECFRRVNIPLGNEEIYLLRRSICEASGITLPAHELSAFDDSDFIETFYTDSADGVLYRNHYSVVNQSDQATIAASMVLMEQLISLLPDHGHLLTPAYRDNPLTWRETVGEDW